MRAVTDKENKLVVTKREQDHVFAPDASYTTTNSFSFSGKTIAVTLQAYIDKAYITADFVSYDFS